MKNILYQESIVEIKHLFHIMKITTLILFIFAGTAFATETYSQVMKVTVMADKISTGKVINEIEKQTDYLFVYNVNEVNLKRTVQVNAENKSVAEVLNKVFEGTDIYYAMEGKNIMLMSKAKENSSVQQTENKIKGVVKDTNGEPIIGANITVKGQSIGTITDIDGRFILEASTNALLQVTYIGYVSQELQVNNRKEITIILQEDAKALEEVVVIGYGTAKKSDLTGSTAQIKPEALTASVVGNALESLQGKAAGVAVFNDNKPGASPSIRVRGSGSITASNEPLYVVDGFPLMDGNISDLNPSDIESMEILKDASSTAIYGSRGANGVVMITTKKGKSGTKNLSVNTSVGVQIPGRLANLISGEDFINFMNAGYKNQGSNVPFPNNPSTYATDTNWEKEILENSSLLQDYSITFDGSSNKTNYMLSTGFYNQEGLLKAQNYQKYTFHGNLQHSFNKWLTIGANTQFTYSIQDVFDSALIDIYRYGWPTEKIKDEDGAYNIASMHNTYMLYPWNPVLDMNETTTRFTTNRFLGSLFAEMQLTKDLKYRLSLGIDLKNTRKYNYVSSESAINKASGLKGNGYNNWDKRFSKVMENILTYNHTWNKHRLTATAVYSWQDFTYEDINLSGSGFENDQTGAWSMGLADKSSVSWATNKYSNKLISFTGRVSYVYDDKYLLTATSRWDGSSRFGANSKWGYFPSVGLGWRLSQESFLKSNKVITNLKIRSSFGITGNQEIGNYQSLATYKAYGWYQYGGNNFHVWGPSKNVNSELRWEKGHNQNIGLDFSLFKHKVTGSFNYFHRKQSDLLGSYSVSVPPNLFSTIYANVGTLRNTGFELDITVNAVRTKDFTYSFTLVGATNNNKFVSFSNDVYKGQKYYSTCNMANPNNPGYLQRIEEGERIGNYFTYRYAGVDKKGDWLIYDKKGNVIPVAQGTEEDKSVTGNGLPKFTGSMTHNFTYKNFDLTVALRGAAGFDIFNVHDFYFGLQSMSTNQLTTAYSKNAHITTGKNVITDYFIEPGDYLKIDNITLGYTMNLNKKYIEKIRLFGTANNLYTFTKFTGVDPSTYEVNGLTPGTFGGGYNYYPSAFQFILGLQVSF